MLEAPISYIPNTVIFGTKIGNILRLLIFSNEA